jgi:VWFA-related protein
MRTRLSWTLLLVAALTASASSTFGQAPAAQQAPASSAPAQPAAVFQVGANLVLVDVVVTDQGNAVHGLDRSRFHVLEDGREQVITSFDEHTPSGTAMLAVKPAALPPNVFSNIPAYPEVGAVNVLLLDGLNTPMPDQMQVRLQMLQFMGQIKPGTSLAIFTLSSRLRLVEGFTTNVAQLTKVLQSSKAMPQASVVLDLETSTTSTDMASLGASANAVSAIQQFEADTAAFQTDLRVRMTLDAMRQLARYLSAIPGRKNLIWFSASFPVALDPDYSLLNPFLDMSSYADDIRETSELLSASRVAVYPVDARGLMTPSSAQASYNPPTSLLGNSGSSRHGSLGGSNPAFGPNMSKNDAKLAQQTMAEHASMQQIAEQTGGQEYINTNGLKEAVAKAVENGSSYYTISYVPDAKRFDGKFRKIQLRLDNARYQLAYRRGYYADPPDKPYARNPGKTSPLIAETMLGAPPATQILFQARALPATDPLLKDAKLPDGPAGEMSDTLKGPVQRYIVDLKVEPQWLSYEMLPNGVRQAAIEITLVAYDADAKRVNYLDRSFRLSLNDEQYARTMATGIPARLPLDLPAGQIALRIAVHDLAAGRAGSLEIPVKVAAR